ncbi:MAG: helix-turn-helix transcriptional regulator [Aestuariivirga sp.]
MSAFSESSSAYSVFTENLLGQVRRRGTIAETCRATDINRQQFNKYLSGQVLPSRENLEKICKYFGIKSQSLFISDYPSNKKERNFYELFKLAAKDSIVNGLKPGLYWIYCEMPSDQCVLQRILINVTSTGNMKRIFAVRRAGEVGKAIVGQKPSLIEGVAVQNGNRLSILFREINNLTRWGMVNIMVNEYAKDGQQVGLLLDFLPWNTPSASPIVTQFITSNSSMWRNYYPQTGFLQSTLSDKYAQDAINLLNAFRADGFDSHSAGRANSQLRAGVSHPLFQSLML